MVMTCPLCTSASYTTVYEYTVSDIARAYQQDPLYGDGGVAVTDEFDNNVSTIDLKECMACGLRYFDPLVVGSANLYSQLQRYPWYYKPGGDDKWEFDFVEHNYLQPHKSVLELGAGDAHFAQRVQALYQGVDPYSQHKLVIKESIESYSQRGLLWDMVCAFQTMEHVRDPRSFLAHAVSCVAPDGLLILSVPSEECFLGNTVDFSLNLPPHHVTRWTDRALEYVTQLESVSLVALHHEPLTEFHKHLIDTRAYQPIDPGVEPRRDWGHTVLAVYQKSPS